MNDSVELDIHIRYAEYSTAIATNVCVGIRICWYTVKLNISLTQVSLTIGAVRHNCAFMPIM